MSGQGSKGDRGVAAVWATALSPSSHLSGQLSNGFIMPSFFFLVPSSFPHIFILGLVIFEQVFISLEIPVP